MVDGQTSLLNVRLSVASILSSSFIRARSQSTELLETGTGTESHTVLPGTIRVITFKGVPKPL